MIFTLHDGRVVRIEVRGNYVEALDALGLRE
jgi:hypothetical protein